MVLSTISEIIKDKIDFFKLPRDQQEELYPAYVEQAKSIGKDLLKYIGIAILVFFAFFIIPYLIYIILGL